jgi:hypothetical protein
MNQNSRDELNLFEGCRYKIMNKISILVDSKEKQAAKEVFKILYDFTTINNAPFQDKDANEYLNYLHKVLIDE